MTLETFVIHGLRAACALGLVATLSACAASKPSPSEPVVEVTPSDPVVVVPPLEPVAEYRSTAAPEARASTPVIPQPGDAKIAVAGTAFPVDGTAGRVPPGSRLVVRVYDAAKGDVNIRVAEGAFDIVQGLPARYNVPAPARDVQVMRLPAVAARVEGPRGRVIYRNETAVLLQPGRAGDIPMTLQRVQAASSSVSPDWTTPATE